MLYTIKKSLFVFIHTLRQTLTIKQENDNPDLNLQRLWSCSDRSFAFYDAIVEEAVSEEVMLAAKKLTTSALDRIGVLKTVLKEE